MKASQVSVVRDNTGAGTGDCTDIPTSIEACLTGNYWPYLNSGYGYTVTYDRGAKALSIVRKLINGKHIKVDTVEQFIKIMDEIITLL